MAISTTRRTLTTLFSRSLSYTHPPPSLPSRSSYAPSFLSHQPTQLAPPDLFRFQSRSESTWSALNGSDHKRSNREEEAKKKIDPVSKSDSHRYRKSQHMSPLHFHYEDVLRQDLLLKLNPANVMQVPRLSKITVQQKAAPSSSNTKNGKLAMEILCGQKFIQTETALTGKSSKSNQFLRSNKDKRGFVSSLAYQSTLRADGMLHFMVRLLTVMSLFDFPVKIGGKCIQFSMEMEFCEVSPELESHLEIFEEITGFNVSIATSANTKAETLLLWSGFLHQDEGEK